MVRNLTKFSPWKCESMFWVLLTKFINKLIETKLLGFVRNTIIKFRMVVFQTNRPEICVVTTWNNNEKLLSNWLCCHTTPVTRCQTVLSGEPPWACACACAYMNISALTRAQWLVNSQVKTNISCASEYKC